MRTQSFSLRTSRRKSYQAKRIVFNDKISGLNDNLSAPAGVCNTLHQPCHPTDVLTACSELHFVPSDF